MKKASDYQAHALECRELAAKMEKAEARDQLLAIAAHWEQLAHDRLDLIKKHPELAVDGEHEELRRLQAGVCHG